jgi:Flp pilus assembly protein TadB
MAQTKRKRRSKHRGNAAGGIEARGRTGRKPTADEARKSARQSARERRMAKPPSWNSAALKALAMAAVLFALTSLHVLGKSTTVGQSLLLATLALVFYTPLAYVTDRWVYQRMLRQQNKQKG